MREIMDASDTNSSNTWGHENGFTYFCQMGRENRDGAVTGTVYKILKDGSCKTSGSFRIEPEGAVSRFPCLNKKMKDRVKLINIEVEKFC